MRGSTTAASAHLRPALIDQRRHCRHLNAKLLTTTCCTKRPNRLHIFEATVVKTLIDVIAASDQTPIVLDLAPRKCPAKP